ncbi:putative endonuclease lcl3 [Ceratobasidium sp. 428]|nr:putative endonuclease lcl3 [Ceratobasidium sp. 428]
MEMLKAGWATVYEQSGAEYHPYTKDAFLKAEAAVRATRKGIWTKGKLAETPAEYKKRHAAAEAHLSR